MFLAAVARPRVEPATGETFDGKIGIWLFSKVVAAQLSSKNRKKGTLEAKPIDVNRDTYRCYIIEKVLYKKVKDGMEFETST